MDALEPVPLFKSVIGLELPSGERCHNDTALLHNGARRQPLPASLTCEVLMLMSWRTEAPRISQTCGQGLCGTPAAA